MVDKLRMAVVAGSLFLAGTGTLGKVDLQTRALAPRRGPVLA